MTNVEELAADLNRDYSEIVSNAESAEEIAVNKGINLEETTLMPYFDMNGPIVDKESIDYKPIKGVREAMHLLDDITDFRLTMLSGWDISTLQFVAEERLNLEMDHVGELGSQAVIDGRNMTTVEASYDKILEFRKDLWLAAGVEELTLNEQGNISPVTGCTYAEGQRAGLYEDHPLAERSRERFSPEKFYQDLKKRGAPEQALEAGEDDVSVDLSSDRAVESLNNVLTHDYPLLGLEYESSGDLEIRIQKNTEGTSNMSDEKFLAYFQGFMDNVSKGTVFEPDHNPDFSTDYQRKDIKVSKKHGANFRAEKIFGNEDFALVNVGDKPGDVLNEDNSIDFAQEGMPVVNYVKDNDIQCVYVQDAADYALTVAEIMARSE